MQPISILFAFLVGWMTLLTMTYSLSIDDNQVMRNSFNERVDFTVNLFHYRRLNRHLLMRVLNALWQINVFMILVLARLISVMTIYTTSMMNTIAYDVSTISVPRNV